MLYIAEANKIQPLITIGMVKQYFYLRHVGADTKVISMWQPYTDMILYTIHRHKIHEQSIFPRFFIFVFNSTIDSLYFIDLGKLFQSRHALNKTEFMP